MCCLENQIRGTLSGQQFRARKRQLASNNSLHARMQCSGGSQRKAKSQENAGTTGGRRQKRTLTPPPPPPASCSPRISLAWRHQFDRSTLGAPQKMRWQDAATQGPTNQVFGGDAHGLSLPQARRTQPRRVALCAPRISAEFPCFAVKFKFCLKSFNYFTNIK